MIRHYYTLTKLVEEFQFLVGYKLVECFTQEKNSLVMMLYNDGQEHYLCYSGDTKFGGIYLRDNFSKARKNIVSQFDFLLGKEIIKISIIPNERILQISFSDYLMNIILFGGSKNNIIVTNTDNFILDTFKSKKNFINKYFQIHKSELKSINNFPPDFTIIKALSDCDLLLSKHYAEELCVRLNISPQTKLNELTIPVNDLISQAEKLKFECLNSDEYYILENDNEERLLSLILLKNYTKVIRNYKSINDAVRDRIITSYKQDSFKTELNKIRALLDKQKFKLQKSLEHLMDSNKNTERTENYKLWAESLLTLKNLKERIGKSITVTQWDGTKIEIPLNPKLTVRENIDYYFQKVKDSKEAEKVKQKRIPILKSKLSEIENALIKLDSCTNIKEIETFKNEYQNLLKSNMDDMQTQEEKFRRFELADGYVLYVGKSAANNDELTMHFAKPNDIWLHARGAGGSHAVLRLKTKDEKPPKVILQKAAEITAYYSQARKGKFVPVAYTYKKYVHKPKGADPGSVVISREQVIMVEPKILQLE